jgi:hypothetical protein
MLSLSETDKEALDSLRDAGSDLTKAHPFEFYIYHNNKADAQLICADLKQDGFQASVREDAIEDEWLCLTRLSFVPSIEKLAELDLLFEEIITKYGGEYDGWETIVISE